VPRRKISVCIVCIQVQKYAIQNKKKPFNLKSINLSLSITVFIIFQANVLTTTKHNENACTVHCI